jgi:hypothetical protein
MDRRKKNKKTIKNNVNTKQTTNNISHGDQEVREEGWSAQHRERTKESGEQATSVGRREIQQQVRQRREEHEQREHERSKRERFARSQKHNEFIVVLGDTCA